MLKVEHLTIQDDTRGYLLQDVSFTLPNQGFVAIHGDHSTLHHALSQVLSGITKPQNGCLIYNETSIYNFTEEERSCYRSIFVMSLFQDFQILKEKSVVQNITMDIEYPSEKVEQELLNWGLLEKQNMLAEDLSTREQWKMVLIRCILRQPMMLVMDVQSCPLSPKELEEFYPLLETLHSRMLVIVIGDPRSYSFANRIIEIEKGYILSDSSSKITDYPLINHNSDTFQLTRYNMSQLQEKLKTHIRWKLRCASVLCVIAFIALSTAVFSTTLDIVDIQAKMMKSKGSSIIAIEKLARDNDNSINSNYYSTLGMEDMEMLQQNLDGSLSAGYRMIDEKAAMLFAYGTIIDNDVKNPLDDYTIIEAKDATDLGLGQIIGQYPQNYDEIAISSNQAYELLGEVLIGGYKNSDEQNEEMLNRIVYWYGNPLRITGIFPSQQTKNMNMELDMRGYSNLQDSGSMSKQSFFVKKGFTTQYAITKEKVYQKSYKRLISGAQVLTSFENIEALTSDVYYFNGTKVVMDHKLANDEVLIDFETALNIGYQNTYLYSVNESNEVSFAQRVKYYQDFAKQWIGKRINVQTYAIEDNPISSTIMSTNKTIKGFVIPVSYEYLYEYANTQQQGSIYMHPNALKGYDSKNLYITEAFYHNEDEKKLEKTLAYLNKDPDYNAFLFNSTILNFFVVDLKNLDTLLFVMGGIAFLGFVYIMIFLLNSGIAFMRNELSIYYLFGEKKSTLKKFILQHYVSSLWMRVLFGWLCATLALGTFIFIIYFTLSASSSILWSLVLPLLMLLITIGILRIAFSRTMRKTSVIEEEFMDGEERRKL